MTKFSKGIVIGDFFRSFQSCHLDFKQINILVQIWKSKWGRGLGALQRHKGVT